MTQAQAQAKQKAQAVIDPAMKHADYTEALKHCQAVGLSDLSASQMLKVFAAHRQVVAQAKRDHAEETRLQRNKITLSTGKDKGKEMALKLLDKALPIVKNQIGTAPSMAFTHTQKLNEGDLVTSMTFLRELDEKALETIRKEKADRAVIGNGLKGIVSGNTDAFVKLLQGLRKVNENEAKAVSLLDVRRVKGKDLTEEEKAAGVLRFTEKSTILKDGFAVQVSVALRPISDEERQRRQGKVNPDTIRSTAPAV